MKKTIIISTFLLTLLIALPPGMGLAAEEAVSVPAPAVPRYPPGFMTTLGKLESDQPGNLLEATPGNLEVTLSSSRPKNDYRVSLNTSQQVFSLSAPEKKSSREVLLAASMGPMDPSRSFFRPGNFRSASLLAFKAKQFDDGLYAAVELAVDRGAGKFGSRRELLADLATALTAGQGGADSDKALRMLNFAARFGGHAAEIPAAAIASRQEKNFLDNPLRSKPIGFYTWTPDLVRIFQRDRYLQTKLKPETAEKFAGALGSEAALLERYRAALRLPERLTNGFAYESLAGAATEIAAGKLPPLKDLALFPPSRAYETDLIEKLFSRTPIPDGFNLADEMVRRIQSGKLELEPREDSGWYDHQTYALEPLVIPDQMPEAKRLQLDESYKKELVKLFKGLLALNRETHAKQLRVSLGAIAAFDSGGDAPPPPTLIELRLSPQLTQEPLATFYLRRALAYRFVRSVLVGSFGDAGLSNMKRLTANGPVNLTLDRELCAMESLFYGAYLNTARELGMTLEKQDGLGLGEAGSLALYRSWKPYNDPDVAQDIRMMVPVFYDVQRRMTKVWVVMGVTTQPVKVSYSTPPILESVTDSQGNPIDLARVDFQCESAAFEVPYPVMAEIYVEKILNLEEMRALCDEHKTRKAILEHLK